MFAGYKRAAHRGAEGEKGGSGNCLVRSPSQRRCEAFEAGQFVIARPRVYSERIPQTLVDGDAEKDTVTLVVQAVGKRSHVMTQLNAGEVLSDLLGPRGQAAVIEIGNPRLDI